MTEDRLKEVERVAQLGAILSQPLLVELIAEVRRLQSENEYNQADRSEIWDANQKFLEENQSLRELLKQRTQYGNKIVEENQRLQAKLERTKGHMSRKLKEEDTVNQKVFDEMYEENKRFREALVKIRDSAEDNLIAAIADDALVPTTIVLSEVQGYTE